MGMPHCTESKLANGMKVITEHNPHTDAATLCVWVMSGARDEGELPPGTAHMLEHMIFRGTKHRSGEEINRLVEGYGGEMNAVTTAEYMCFYLSFLKENLAMSIELLADLLANPLLSEAVLESEKHVVIEEIRLHAENPEKFIFDALRMSSWGESSLARIETGSVEDVKSIKAEHLRAFMNSHFLSGNMLISASGNLKHEEVVALAEKYFGQLPDGKANPRREKPKFVAAQRIYPGGEAQAHLAIGFEGLSFSHPDIFALKLLTALLGIGTSSKLYRILREQEALAYDVFAHHQSYSDTGLLGIYAGVAKERVEKAKERIIEVVNATKEGNFSQIEFQTAKNMLIGMLIRKLESSTARAFVLGEHAIYFGKLLTIEEIKRKIEDVSEADLLRIARQMLNKQYSCAIVQS